VLALAREGYTWRRVRPAELLATLRFAGFRTMARKYWRTGAYENVPLAVQARVRERAPALVPALRAEDIRPGGAGVRARRLTSDGALVDDFRIVQSADAVTCSTRPRRPRRHRSQSAVTSRRSRRRRSRCPRSVHRALKARSVQAKTPVDRGLAISYSVAAMITVPARRVKQFGVEFYQAGLSAKDIDRLVKFEVLGYITDDMNGDAKAKARKAAASRSRVNWDLLEKRISESEKRVSAADHPPQDRRAGRVLPRVQGRRDAAGDSRRGHHHLGERFTFTPVAGHHDLGLLQIPEEHGVLRVLDGQHRLLALHSLSRRATRWVSRCRPCCSTRSTRARSSSCRAINAKHTRLNPSHIISLAGRKLYPDPNQALAHDVIARSTRRHLAGCTARSRCSAPAVGGSVSAARRGDRGPARDGREARRRRAHPGAAAARQALLPELHEGALDHLPSAWAGRKYSIKTGAALRAFVRAAPDVMARAKELKRARFAQPLAPPADGFADAIEIERLALELLGTRHHVRRGADERRSAGRLDRVLARPREGKVVESAFMLVQEEALACCRSSWMRAPPPGFSTVSSRSRSPRRAAPY